MSTLIHGDAGTKGWFLASKSGKGKKRTFRALLLVALCLVAAWGSVVFFERVVLKRIGAFQPDAPGHDLGARERTIRTLDLHPWTGWHVQPDFRHVGDMPWEAQAYRDYDIATARLGFFDIDVLNVAPKGACERRVALIGGSGAQGWGASRNERTLARRLEAHLGAEEALGGLSVRVLNLTMGASITYQNFIALNRFGQGLGLDMIASYSGRNEFVVAEQNGNDGFYQFNELLALNRVVRRSEASGLGDWLSSAFPRLMERTGLGAGLRMTGEYRRLLVEAPADYARQHGFDALSPAEFLERVVSDNHIGALKSIKRDFAGLPMVLVWQSVMRWETDKSRFASTVGADFYEGLYERARRELVGYHNDDWIFVDAHRHMKAFPVEDTGTHLGDAGQDRVARLVATAIAPRIAAMRGDCPKN